MSAPPDLAAPVRIAPTTTMLFLIADTGGGHRRAAAAVTEALQLDFPGRFDTVVCDPLGGPDSSRLVRSVCGLYGPVTCRAPRLWGGVYRLSDSAPAMRLLQQSVFANAAGPVLEAVRRHRPAVIVSFHPLTGAAAVAIGRRGDVDTPVVTVVTDLVTAHRAWLERGVDRIVVPTTALLGRCQAEGFPARCCVEIGIPVSPQLTGPRPSGPDQQALRLALGVPPRRFLVVVTGGAEGSGAMAGRVGDIVDHFDQVQVVCVCGRNQRLRRRLAPLARRTKGRLRVLGYVDNLGAWMRAADVLVTKAGPGTIAEAACCGVPLILTSYLPGQEAGNIELVVAAGAGRYAPTVPRLVEHIGELLHDQDARAAMSLAATRLSRPRAAHQIAALLAGLADRDTRIGDVVGGRLPSGETAPAGRR